MFRRFSTVAVALAALCVSTSKAEVLTFTIDESQSAQNVFVQVFFGPGPLAQLNVASSFSGQIVADLTRDGMGNITAVQFDSSSSLLLADVGTIADPVIVNLGALGTVPSRLIDITATLASEAGGIFTNSPPIAVAGGAGNLMGQAFTTTAGTAILGPGTGPIGPVLDPVDFTTESSLSAATAFGNSPFTITEGPGGVTLAINSLLFFDNILNEESFALTVDFTLTGPIVATAVPEVGTFAMMGAATGLIGVGGLIRRRMRQS